MVVIWVLPQRRLRPGQHLADDLHGDVLPGVDRGGGQVSQTEAGEGAADVAVLVVHDLRGGLGGGVEHGGGGRGAHVGEAFRLQRVEEDRLLIGSGRSRSEESFKVKESEKSVADCCYGGLWELCTRLLCMKCTSIADKVAYFSSTILKSALLMPLVNYSLLYFFFGYDDNDEECYNAF